jgi:hypothetical protein
VGFSCGHAGEPPALLYRAAQYDDKTLSIFIVFEKEIPLIPTIHHTCLAAALSEGG